MEAKTKKILIWGASILGVLGIGAYFFKDKIFTKKEDAPKDSANDDAEGGMVSGSGVSLVDGFLNDQTRPPKSSGENSKQDNSATASQIFTVWKNIKKHNFSSDKARLDKMAKDIDSLGFRIVWAGVRGWVLQSKTVANIKVAPKPMSKILPVEKSNKTVLNEDRGSVGLNQDRQ